MVAEPVPATRDRLYGACAVTTGGAVLLAASALLRWASLGVGNASASTTLIAAPVAAIALGMAVVTIGGGALATLSGRAAGLDLAALAGATVAVVVTAFIVGSEIAVAASPDDPAFVLVSGLNPGAGAGAWLALAAALLVVAAAAKPIRERLLATLLGPHRRSALPIAALVLALVALAQLRFEAWLEGTASGSTLTVSAGALPVVSSVTFLAVVLLGAGILAACIGYQQIGGLAAAAAGWLANVAAAITIAGARTLGGLHLHVAHVSLGAWSTFAVGLSVAVAAGVLIIQTGEPR